MELLADSRGVAGNIQPAGPATFSTLKLNQNDYKCLKNEDFLLPPRGLTTPEHVEFTFPGGERPLQPPKGLKNHFSPSHTGMTVTLGFLRFFKSLLFVYKIVSLVFAH